MRAIEKKPTSLLPEILCGAERVESLDGVVPLGGHTTSRWYAISDLSEMRTNSWKSSMTAI
jgi:hypothetical protein